MTTKKPDEDVPPPRKPEHVTRTPPAPPVEGQEALADPTPIGKQGPEVIAPAKPMEEPELALQRSQAAGKAKAKEKDKDEDDDDDDAVSGGERARRKGR